MPKAPQNRKADSSVQPPDFPDLTPPQSNLATPPRPRMRPYQGPVVDPVSGFPLKDDAKRRIAWEGIRDEYGNWIVVPIKCQVFRLDNGVILQARSEVEAGAYLNKGGELVDTIYHDEKLEFQYEHYTDPDQAQ